MQGGSLLTHFVHNCLQNVLFAEYTCNIHHVHCYFCRDSPLLFIRNCYIFCLKFWLTFKNFLFLSLFIEANVSTSYTAAFFSMAQNDIERKQRHDKKKGYMETTKKNECHCRLQLCVHVCMKEQVCKLQQRRTTLCRLQQAGYNKQVTTRKTNREQMGVHQLFILSTSP